MRCDAPLGHAASIRGLWRAARAGRLAHALLFRGPRGIGKFLAAEWLARGLLCASPGERPCGECGPCKRFRSDSHPDVFVLDGVDEGQETIPIGAITPRPEDSRPSVSEFLELRALESGYRIVLVREADRMASAAQNALLKTLEEPGMDVVIVLESARPDLLLPTVKSRCVQVRLRALALSEVESVLAAHGLDAARARVLARWSGGSPGTALRIAARAGEEMRGVLVRVLSGELDPTRGAAAIDAAAGEFPGATPSASARMRARAFLELSTDVLRDLHRARCDAAAETLPHGDLAPLARTRTSAAWRAALDHCLTARQDVDLNLAPDAAVERVLLSCGARAVAGSPVSSPTS